MSEQKQYALEIYGDLTEWLTNETTAILKKLYVALGSAEQGGQFRGFKSWAVAIAGDHFWNFVQQESLHEEPVEFWGGVTLFRLVDSFLDQVFYCVLLAYGRAGENESKVLSFLARRRSA